MDSPVFVYSPGWRVDAGGADPSEPDDPWQEPAGRFAFDYAGRSLALQLAVGNYWGFVFVTVDGVAANRLPVIGDNVNASGEAAGYKPLLAPELQTAEGPAPRWFTVHVAEDDGPHRVEIEVWRSWGQVPVRAVAVDALPTPTLPEWPGQAFAILALLAASATLFPRLRQVINRATSALPQIPWLFPESVLFGIIGVGLIAVGAGVGLDRWWLTDAGLLLLALAGVQRPLLWVGALLFGLPFYLHPLPILPGRALNLVEIGIWGGLALLMAHQLLWQPSPVQSKQQRYRSTESWLGGVVVLALVATLAAQQEIVALREWRTIFLAAGAFAMLVVGLRRSDTDQRALRLLFFFWLLGGLTVAAVGLWQYAAGRMLIEAEGVNRVRAFYGSPNNLALYLERTATVALALALFQQTTLRRRIGWWLMTIPQLIALLLTFSKGALLLALPAALITLGMGGFVLLRRRGDGLRPLWGLALVAVGMVFGLLPFLGAERFRSLADFSAGTTGGLRLNLWRSSLRMALDHPWLGVGPDNFLYAYRSGYILPAAWQDPDLNHPHNVLLDWWTRLGMGGLLLAVGWLLTGVRGLWRGVWQGEEAALRLGSLAAIAAALAHGLIDASYALPDLIVVWVLLLGVGKRSVASGSIEHE
ncbi:MAG: O-antigen ligase family protein [Caldilineaceae bacterium]